jgi:hypothetical protein
MVALADPNQVLQTALGGQNAANNFTASTVGPMLGDLVGNAPAPVPQQTELPEINIDALRKISDPRIMQMAFNMLMQRDAMKARGQEFGVMPGYWGQLNPAERRTDALRIAGGGANTRYSPRPAEAQGMSEEEWREYSAQLRKKKLEANRSIFNALGIPLPEETIEPPEGRVEPKSNAIAPRGLEQIWPKLSETVKDKVRRAITKGATIEQILEAPDLAAHLRR